MSFIADIPEDIDGTFYNREVHVGLKENCFRHACELDKLLTSNKPVECYYHDGGPDHNIRFARTQLAIIAFFLQQDLDMLVSVQTTPHHSWKTPVERVMSNVNLGLQDAGVMRKEMAILEPKIKSTNNMKAIRNLKLHDALGLVQPYETAFVDKFAPTDRRRRRAGFIKDLVFPFKTDILHLDRTVKHVTEVKIFTGK